MNQRLIQAQHESGLSKREIADIVGITLRSYQYYESGRIPKLLVALRMAKALRRDPAYLFTPQDIA